MIGEISSITMHSDSKEVMKITRDGIWVNPDVSVDEAAKTVLAAIDKNILFLLEKERERERERCAKLCDAPWTSSTGMILASAIREMK